MAHILTNRGEEFLFKVDVSARTTLTIGLYNDTTDAVADTSDVAAITTRPNGASYGDDTAAAITVRQIAGDWGFDNDAELTFNTSDSTNTVDSYFIIANFQGDGDAAATDHLIATGALSQSYDLNNVDTLNVAATSAGVTVS